MCECKTMGRQRGEAAVAAFNRVLPTCKTLDEAYAKAAKEPAPRFFVEFPRAYRCVSELERYGKRVSNPLKAAMYDELHRRWKAKGVKHYAVLEEILKEPAPSFYIEPWTFRTLVYKMLREGKKRYGDGEKKD